MNSNKNLRIASVIGVMILFLIGLLVGRFVSDNTQSASAQVNQGIELIATPENLLYLGINFEELDTDDPIRDKLISEKEALEIAYASEPNLMKAVRFSTRLGLIQSDTQIILRTARPVWMITYHGIESISLGPIESPHYTSEEFTVVIDADKGEYLLGFPLFNVTPQAPAHLPTIVPNMPISSTPEIDTQIRPTATPQ